MICARCQHDNPDDHRYCGECGHALSPEAEAVPRYADRAKLLRREAAVVAAGIILLLAAAFGFWWLLVFRASPEGVVRRFIEADQAGDASAQKLLVVDRADAQFVLAVLQTFRQQTGTSVFRRYRISGISARGESAVVDVTVYLPQVKLPGQAAPVGGTAGGTSVSFFLTRQGREWRIDPTQTIAALAGVMAANGFRSLLPPGVNVPMPGSGLGFPGFPGAPGAAGPTPGSGISAAPAAPTRP